MRVEGEELKSITFGAVEIIRQDKVLTFYKCTKKQQDGWKSIDNSLFERSQIATGVRFDFHTDSKTFAFKAVSGRKFDVLINGVITYSLRNLDFDDSGTSKTMKISDGGDTRVTLVFPSHDIKTSIENIRLDDGAYFRAHEHSVKILFMGDSITQGWNSEFDSMSYAWQTTLYFNADSVINGVGGGMFHECTFDTSDFDPDVVVVAYGTNDYKYYKSLDELNCHVQAFLDLVKKAYGDKKVLCVLPIWRSDADSDAKMGTFGQCCDTIKEQIISHGFYLVDGDKIVPHFGKFYADHVHPNDLGFCMYAKALQEHIEKILKD